MNVFDIVDDKIKSSILSTWKTMKTDEKDQFIDQVSIALSVWGSDELGKKLVINVMSKLLNDGSESLSDFGLYIPQLLDNSSTPKELYQKVKRAYIVIDSYRIKHALPSEPHKNLGF